jgi:hypothetical protein
MARPATCRSGVLRRPRPPGNGSAAARSAPADRGRPAARVSGVRRADQGVVAADRRRLRPVGSIVGQSRFRPGLVVREGRDNASSICPGADLRTTGCPS